MALTQPKTLVLSIPKGYNIELQLRDELVNDTNSPNALQNADDATVAQGSKWGVNDDGNIYSDCGCGGGNCAC